MSEEQKIDGVVDINAELAQLRTNVKELVQAVHALVKLQSVLNQAVQQLLKRDGTGADCVVIR